LEGNISAQGDATITFGNAVPEPPTYAIWLLFGAAGMVIGWRRWAEKDSARKNVAVESLCC